MDVTRTNFEELFPTIKDALIHSSFITLDGEFTGLNIGSEIKAFDTPSEYYDKLRRGSKDFLLIQLGVCFFRFDTTTKVYRHCCYNFYAFPKPPARNSADTFLCQSSSIDFLASQGFDFNKLFKDGIPYLTHDEEERLQEQLHEKHKTRESSNNTYDNQVIPVPEEDKAYIDGISSKVEEFLESDEIELVLDRCNSFLRRLVYQTLRIKFKDQIFVETRTQENKNLVIVVQKSESPEDMALKEQIRKDRESAELISNVGLSRVLQLIADSGKLVVGHNMLLDLMHILKQFFAPLPDHYLDFKEYLKCLFPRLLDTKLMSNMAPFKVQVNSNVLGHLLATLSEDPFKLPQVELEDNGHGYTKATIREHEAGYDAYITGLCFLSMAGHLEPLEDVGGSVADSLLLKPFMNRLFLMRLHDYPFMNLSGKDTLPNRDHVFHITFPSTWKRTDILQLFSPYGTVNVSWLNETSAYVALHKRDQSSCAKNQLGKLKMCTVVPYKQYKASLRKATLYSGVTIQKRGSSTEARSVVASLPNLPLGESRTLPTELIDVDRSRKRRLASEESSTNIEENDAEPRNGNVPGPSKATRLSSETGSAISPTIAKTFEESDSWE